MKVYDKVKRFQFNSDSFVAPYEMKFGDKKYLDLHSGAGAFFFDCSVAKGQNTTNFFETVKVSRAIEAIEKTTQYRCPILLCSGSEANEASIKLAFKRDPEREIVYYVPGCYFGRTYLANMCSDNEKYKSFLPKTDMFVPVAHPEDLSLAGACLILERYPSVSLEWDLPILDLVGQAKKLGIVVIVDETKGAFRTGSIFSFGDEFRPDVVTVSKSLASGFPVSAVLVDNNLLGECDDEWYTTTTGGHPAGCDIIIANMEKSSKNYLEDSVGFENEYRERLEKLFGDRLHIKGKYISLSRMKGLDFGGWCNENGLLVYTRSNFISFFPNQIMFEGFRALLRKLEDNKSGLYRFFRE